jgi:hypothetical protein
MWVLVLEKNKKKKNQIESLFDDCALAARAEPCTFIQRQLCPNFISS